MRSAINEAFFASNCTRHLILLIPFVIGLSSFSPEIFIIPSDFLRNTLFIHRGKITERPCWKSVHHVDCVRIGQNLIWNMVLWRLPSITSSIWICLGGTQKAFWKFLQASFNPLFEKSWSALFRYHVMPAEHQRHRLNSWEDGLIHLCSGSHFETAHHREAHVTSEWVNESLS